MVASDIEAVGEVHALGGGRCDRGGEGEKGDDELGS